jgi:hypothetical protein
MNSEEVDLFAVISYFGTFEGSLDVRHADDPVMYFG